MTMLANARKIVVFGEGAINSFKAANGEFYFPQKNFYGHLADYDIIIYSIGVFPFKIERTIWAPQLHDAPPAAIQRANEIQLALEKGKTVCFIGPDCNDYVVNEILCSNDIRPLLIENGKVFRNLRVRRSEFKQYLDDLGASSVSFAEQSVDTVISTIFENVVTGFSKKVGKGLLLFLPTVWGTYNPTYITEHLVQLVHSIISFSTREFTETPKYLENFCIKGEKNVRDQIQQILQTQVQPLEERMQYYQELKSILWLGDNNLVKAVNSVLQKIGLETLIDEIYEEDLWITTDGKKQVIVEIKGLNNNLTRQDISKLDEHREARLVPQLAGLLIANTFRTANSIENKNQPFPPNVIEKAVNSNLIITRTIDLVTLIDYFGDSAGESIIKAIKNEKGWLSFDGHKIVVIH